MEQSLFQLLLHPLMGDPFVRFYQTVGLIPQGFVEMFGPDLGVETYLPSAQLFYGFFGAFYQQAAGAFAPEPLFHGNPSQDPDSRFLAGEETADPHGFSLVIPQETVM